MFPANAYVIRPAGEDDRATHRRLADLDAARPIAEPALIGEIHGYPAAALSLVDGRVVADPFEPTAHLLPIMRVRADAVNAFAEEPSLRVRLLAGLRVRRVAARTAA